MLHRNLCVEAASGVGHFSPWAFCPLMVFCRGARGRRGKGATNGLMRRSKCQQADFYRPCGDGRE